MTQFPSRMFQCVVGAGFAALLLLAVSLVPARAGGIPSDPAPLPDIRPTRFVVDNETGARLYAWRLRGSDGAWIDVGDLPPGRSEWTISVRNDVHHGSFTLRLRPAPAAHAVHTLDADTLIGAYAPPIDGRVWLRIPAGAMRSLQAMPAGVAGAAPDFVPAPGAEYPLQHVPGAAARPGQQGNVQAMVCSSIPGPWFQSMVSCIGDLVSYFGVGFGVNVVPMSYGVFESSLTSRELIELREVDALFEGVAFGMGAEFTSGDTEVGSYGAAALGAGVVSTTGSFSARGTIAPPGSYHDTCSDVSYDPQAMSLQARCLDHSGRLQDSTLLYVQCPGSDVSNADGQLRCDLPEGTYRASCVAPRLELGVLTASCRNLNNALNDAWLDFQALCEPDTTVSNQDGVLACDASRSDPPPAGPYRNSCSNIRFRQGVLTADCGGVDTRGAGLRLDYARSCRPGAQVAFLPRYAAPGRLACLDTGP